MRDPASAIVEACAARVRAVLAEYDILPRDADAIASAVKLVDVSALLRDHAAQPAAGAVPETVIDLLNEARREADTQDALAEDADRACSDCGGEGWWYVSEDSDATVTCPCVERSLRRRMIAAVALLSPPVAREDVVREAQIDEDCGLILSLLSRARNASRDPANARQIDEAIEGYRRIRAALVGAGTGTHTDGPRTNTGDSNG
jgi:predicted  nucleic acid-binding Zn-ribbon protein